MEQLYNKEHFVIVKSLDKDECKSPIGIAVELQTSSSSSSRKELIIRLTNEKDFCFLFSLRINEDDFQQLKAQQGLLVDFHGFAQRFIDLLELCSGEENRDSPKYIIKFVASVDHSVESWNLLVIETNPFKHLTHLSLKFFLGDDREVKVFLSRTLRTVKDENLRLSAALNRTESSLTKRINDLQQALSEKTVQLDHLRTEWSTKQEEIANKFTQQITSEKEKVSETQTYYHHKYERDKLELEQAQVKIVKQLESRIYDLDTANKCLSDENCKLESQLRDTRSRLDTTQEDYQQVKQEIVASRRQQESTDRELHERETNLNRLTTRVAVLEQEVRDKEQLMSRTQDQYSTEQDHKNRFQEESQRKSRQMEKMEKSMKAMSEELTKGNEIIKKLQSEVRNYHSKVKLRTQITTEQERVIGEKDRETASLREEVSRLTASGANSEHEVVKLREQLDSSDKKLEEAKRILKTNENVINWLNRQITETQLQKQKTFQPPISGAGGNPIIQYRPSSIPVSQTNGTVASSRPFIPTMNPIMSSNMTAAAQNGTRRTVGPLSAPITKSTPIHPDLSGDPSMQPAIGQTTCAVVSMGTTSLTTSGNTNHYQENGHHQPVVNAGLDLKYLRRSETAVAPSPILMGNPPIYEQQKITKQHQHSLTSAYFPKPSAVAQPK